MTFIGIISDSKSFEYVREKVLNNIQNKSLNIININLNSIENIQNIKFNTIVINTNLNKFKNRSSILKKLFINCEFIVLNSDIEIELNMLNNQKKKIISYGLNHKATVTISSLTENEVLIYLQRNIKNKQENIIEVGEKSIKFKEKEKSKIYELLIIFIIFCLNNIKIINEI